MAKKKAKKKAKLNTYIVSVKEVWVEYFKVQATSAEEAEDMIDGMDSFDDKDLGPIITVEKIDG